jgi:hypothetical protein
LPDDLPPDRVAVRGRVVLVCRRSDYFGGPRSRDYKSEKLVNPTWLQVAVCANASVVVTRDQQHVLLEGIDKLGRDGGVAVYEIVMAS